MNEYDTSLREVYVNGYWEQMVAFLRPLFGTTFKGNPYLECGLMTGITRVAKESIFSDLNGVSMHEDTPVACPSHNLDVVTTTSDKYAGCFGFTQQEVDTALKEFGMSDQADAVKNWYDGFTFGHRKNIYNPWSITNFLGNRKLGPYWVNTSSNSLVSELIRRGSNEVKMDCEEFLAGRSIKKPIDEQIVFSQISLDDNALWSFLLAGGYLKVFAVEDSDPAREDQPDYTLALTNGEIRRMFRSMVRGWFTSGGTSSAYQNFLRTLASGNVESMNLNLNRVRVQLFRRGRAGTRTVLSQICAGVDGVSG